MRLLARPCIRAFNGDGHLAETARPISWTSAMLTRHSFVLVACWLALASPTLAQPVLPGTPDTPNAPPGSNPSEPQPQALIPITRDTFAIFLKERDISYDVGRTTPENTPFYTMYVKTLNNQQIYIYFDDCKAEGCRYLRFQAYGPPAKGIDLNFVNGWNRKWIATKLFVTANGGWSLEHYVRTDTGLSVGQIEGNFYEFLFMLHKLFGKEM
jgi:Putative bacterial sensory transduction regulator